MKSKKIPSAVSPAKLYTKSKYSKDFNLARNTINTYIKTGKLTGVPVNGTVLVLDESTDAPAAE